MPSSRRTRRADPRRTSGGDGPRLALWILLGVIILGFAAVRLSPRGHRPRQRPAAGQPGTPPAAPAATHRTPASRPASPTTAAPARQPPAVRPAARFRCAIIIDDVGYNEAVLGEFLDLDLPLTFSVLPQLALSRRTAQAAAEAGHTVMLHLPMEPVEASKIRLMGPGGVTTEMSDAEIEAEVIRDLESLGTAAGINNHMGSKATADPRVMKAVMRVVERRGLFFVDSLTTSQSVAGDIAREFGVPVGCRDVFLDTDVSGEEGIRERVRALIEQAKERGSAIGIGHAHARTARALRTMSAEFERQGVRLVPAGEAVTASE